MACFENLEKCNCKVTLKEVLLQLFVFMVCVCMCGVGGGGMGVRGVHSGV